jgi:hypothetical protein
VRCVSGRSWHVAISRPELLALVHLVGRGKAALGEVHVHRVHADRGRAAQVVQRAVARDPVQPRAHVDVALVGQDRVERGREDLLQHVLGVLLGGEHVPAERQQPRLVARDQRLEGMRVATADKRDQALVGLQPQQRRAPWSPATPVGFTAEASTRNRAVPPDELLRGGKVANDPG